MNMDISGGSCYLELLVCTCLQLLIFIQQGLLIISLNQLSCVGRRTAGGFFLFLNLIQDLSPAGKDLWSSGLEFFEIFSLETLSLNRQSATQAENF